MSGKKIIEGAKQALAHVKGKRGKATVYSALDHKKHGVGGLIRGKLREKKQDRRAEPGEFYVVAFFPKIHGIGKASLCYISHMETMAQSPTAAKIKFMDRIKQGEKWSTYARAGHRVRKIKVTDLGDAA